MSVSIKKAETGDDIAAVKSLFIEYTKGLGIDLGFQGIEKEFASFPEKFDILLLARDSNGAALGAVGSWTLEPGVCEMKRLYVGPKARGTGLGKALSVALMERTKDMGFHTMKLDTLARLTPALALYESLGFKRTDPYNYNPETDILYFERAL